MSEKRWHVGGVDRRAMAIHCKIPYATMNWNLIGRTVPSKITIDAILKDTGMTYEEAFGEE